MRGFLVIVLAMAAAPAWAQQPLTASEVMARVAANQDRAEQLRKEYVYQQHIHVVLRQTNGKLRRDETADYDVFPTPDGIQRKLMSLTGRYLEKGKYVDFHGDADTPKQEEEDLDAELAHDFRDDFANEKSKDGLGRDLFPFTTENQTRYK